MEDGFWLAHTLASSNTRSLKKIGLFLEEDRSMSNMAELVEARPSYTRNKFRENNRTNDTTGCYQQLHIGFLQVMQNGLHI